jgi:TldD protein
MKLPGFPRVYYTAFLLRDIEWFNTWSSNGSVCRRRSDRTRNVYCDLRVGSYKFDQTGTDSFSEEEDLDSFSHVTLPIDDRNFDGMRLTLWRLTDAKFRESLVDYKNKEAAKVVKGALSDFDSFSKLKPIRSIQHKSPERINEDRWVRFCKEISSWMYGLPHISSCWAEFDSSQITKVFVSTEDRIIVQHQQIFSFSAAMKKVTKSGTQIEQELVINAASQDELPSLAEAKERLLKKHEQLINLSRAKRIHSYSGPVLLFPEPAGLLFHEAIGHRLEGSSLLSSADGQTFKGHVGRRVLNIDINVTDNPRLKSFGGVKCIGAYDFDDEGTESDEAVLIQDGVLKGFLNTRAKLSDGPHKLNGHARNKKAQRPISRMAVTIIEGKNPRTMDQMKQLLLDEIRRQKKPFGLIVYETVGGETETGKHDFQAFSGDVSYATLIYPDGHEVPVSGVDLVGTPLQALDNIIAIGKEPLLVNDYCGAESGFIPISTISPAILLSNLELQAKDEGSAPYILPPPRL